MSNFAKVYPQPLRENSVSVCFFFQTKLLKKAMTMLENEKQARIGDKQRILDERHPTLQLSGLSMQDLQVHLSPLI